MGGDGGHQVLQHRHGRKAACHLKGPPDAPAHPLGPGETNDVLAFEQHLAGVGREGAANQIEEGALARAVWTDHGRKRPRRKGQRHIIDCPQATERLSQISDL